MTPTDTDLARYAQIGSSTWSDALDSLAIAGVLQGLTQRAGHGRAVGYATTARHVCGALGDFARADFAVGRLVAATGPGQILMVDMGGAAISTFGGLASLAATQRGAAGVMIDGACRDVDEIRATGLWLASRHVTPKTGKTRVRLQAMGEPVRIGGVVVCEGDLVVADDTGMVVVPRARLAEVYGQACAMLTIDAQVESGIARGLSFAEAASAANYIPVSDS